MTPTLELDALRQWIGHSESASENSRCAAAAPRRVDLARLWRDARPAAPIGSTSSTPNRSTPWDAMGIRPVAGFCRPSPCRGGCGPADGSVSKRPCGFGEQIERSEEVADVALKQGRSGPLCFVTTRARLFASGQLRLTEERDLVFPQRPVPRRARPAAAGSARQSRLLPRGRAELHSAVPLLGADLQRPSDPL